MPCEVTCMPPRPKSLSFRLLHGYYLVPVPETGLHDTSRSSYQVSSNSILPILFVPSGSGGRKDAEIVTRALNKISFFFHIQAALFFLLHSPWPKPCCFLRAERHFLKLSSFILGWSKVFVQDWPFCH